MKIKKLEIVGFKSFVDKTVVNFDHAITGIVGPNGCGKSNVVDAIKWVMGEQSAKQLRGKAMDDVIFSGCDARGPSGFAEVTLTFDNTDGLTPPEYRDYAELTVSRRLDRQGRSDYSINKTPVRLMDVTNLFLGTGVGRRAYSTIEQGRIGFIVSSKPEDRRHMIEEAAGITKFKVRKKAAERKMEHTRANLTRVDDIVGELTRNLASLKRQAQKAERYKKYRSEVRDLELYVATFRYLDLHTSIEAVTRDLTHASARADGARMALRIREAEVEAERAAADRASREVERAQAESYELDNRVRMIEGQIQQLTERLAALAEKEELAERELNSLELSRRGLMSEREQLERALEERERAEETSAERLEEESVALAEKRAAVEETQRAARSAREAAADAQTRIARAEAALVGFLRRREDAAGRREKLRGDREELRLRLEDLAGERVELLERLEADRARHEEAETRKLELEERARSEKEELARLEEQLRELHRSLTKKRSRLESLEELEQRFEGVGAGVRALMSEYAADPDDRVAKGVLGLLSDVFQCPPELERALAATLGERLSYVVVRSADAGRSAIAFLREEASGRATVLPRHPLAADAELPALPSVPSVIGRLVDRVSYAPEDAALARHLLGRVVLVDTLESALELSAREGGERTWVTLEGEVVTGDGAITGGAGEDAAAHRLEMKREMGELVAALEQLEREHGEIEGRRDALFESAASAVEALETIRAEAHRSELERVSSEKDQRQLDEEEARLHRRAEELATEEEELRVAGESVDDEEAATRAELSEAQAAEAEAEELLVDAEGVLEDRQQAVEAVAARVTEVRVMAAQARERAESDRHALSRVERDLAELREREERLSRDVEAGVRDQGRIAGELFVLREELGGVLKDAIVAQERLASFRAHYDTVRDAVGSNEAGLRELRRDLEELAESVNTLKMRDQELRMALSHLLETVNDRHELDVRRVLTDYHHRPLPDAAVNARIDELLKLIQRMGEINLMAIEEYEEKSQRFEYLDGQRRDLVEALGQLEKAIRQMNRESRQLFKDAFHAVNERFKLVFPTLFRGGKAELRLSDPEDLLNTGVDIVAQPPGKRLGSLELMSGGEKALTAVALIFAIFQYKPSPFCILDEVDAPLDEANISRFADAISHMTDRSQFIVITHSKSTMEYADVLYGVTMEQAGISKLVAVELRGDRRPVPSGEQTAAA